MSSNNNKILNYIAIHLRHEIYYTWGILGYNQTILKQFLGFIVYPITNQNVFFFKNTNYYTAAIN